MKEDKKEDNYYLIDQSVDVDKKNAQYIMDNLLKEDVSNQYVDKRRDKEEEKIEYDPQNSLFTKEDEKKFSIYIGENSENITGKRFNIVAFFIGGIYLIYRKLYVIGSLWLFLNTLFLFLAPKCGVNIFIIVFFLLASHFLCGYYANYLIMNHVGINILNLKNKYENDDELIIEKCKEQGGINLLAPTILLIIYSCVFGIIGYGYAYKYYQKYFSKPSENSDNTVNYTFDGIFISDENINMDDYLTVSIPDGYSNSDKFGNFTGYYVYGSTDEAVPISTIEVNFIKNYTDAKTFINAITDFKLELRENVKTYETNGNTWYYIKATESSRNIIYASSIINGKTVLVKFMYYYNEEENILPYFIPFIDSIEISTIV